MRNSLRYSLVFLLPISAALGPYLLPIPAFGISIFGFRLLVLAAILGGVCLLRLHWQSRSVLFWYQVLGYIWVTWGLASALWAPDMLGAVREVAAVGFGVAVATVFSMVQVTEGVLESLRRGWVLSFIITGGVAVWELTTGQHLESAFVNTAPEYSLISIVQSTLGQPNNYAGYLLLALPFLLWSYARVRRWYGKIIYGLAVGAVPVLLAFTSSRLAAVALLLQLLVAIYLFDTRWYVMPAFLASLIAAGMYIFVTFGDELRLIGELTDMASTGTQGQSLQIRYNLLLNGLWIIVATAGFGAGAGSYEALVQAGQLPYATAAISNPHNIWIEVASQYGLVIFSLFCLWLLWVARTALRQATHQTTVLRTVILVGLVGYLFAGMTDSTFLEQSVNWVFLASLACLAESIRAQASHAHNTATVHL